MKTAAWLALLTLLSAGNGSAERRHRTAFTGSWRMDPAHSQFSQGRPFRSFQITFTEDGARHLDLMNDEGKRIEVTLPWSDGKPVTPMGMEGATTVSTIQGRRFHDTWRRDGAVIEDVHGEVARDGRTMKTIVNGRDATGHAYRNQLLFLKE